MGQGSQVSEVSGVSRIAPCETPEELPGALPFDGVRLILISGDLLQETKEVRMDPGGGRRREVSHP